MPNQGVSPQTSLDRCGGYLTAFEKKEILGFDRVYFLGQPTCGKLDPPMPSSSSSAGDGLYDDERGDYRVVPRDHLAYRYEILSILGKGSFGQVLKCFDHRTGQTVAVKLIRNKKRFHTQALVEIDILQKLVQWDPQDKHHNIRMKDHFLFRCHLCITFECLSINLYDFIKTNHFQGFSLGLIQRFTIQILQSLSLLHEHRLIHCDLKPENILLKNPKKSGIKVIDFGSSCLEHEKVYTYIQSRFYRSPEVILGMNYSMAIDMWSVGCILGELYSGYPVFPGENEQEQLACIMEVLDVPNPSLIMASSRRKLFFDSQCQPRIVANSKGKKRYPHTKTLEYLLTRKKSNPHLIQKDRSFILFVDFIHQCLKWDPEQRLTPNQALHHDWIATMKK
ncbi:kinase-like protein [Hesseltinella vesiculosa]|uniref:dual-specificity kinase n=1 Tax=Hesseltinella vesiculosa TaxID=101127 RepID=A0A1X2GKX1_9FUNG|nr:kinase-like protein [Hesseltinella vesiculosa]